MDSSFAQYYWNVKHLNLEQGRNIRELGFETLNVYLTGEMKEADYFPSAFIPGPDRVRGG